MAPLLSGVGASGKPGAVHTQVGTDAWGNTVVYTVYTDSNGNVVATSTVNTEPDVEEGSGFGGYIDDGGGAHTYVFNPGTGHVGKIDQQLDDWADTEVIGLVSAMGLNLNIYSFSANFYLATNSLYQDSQNVRYSGAADEDQAVQGDAESYLSQIMQNTAVQNGGALYVEEVVAADANKGVSIDQLNSDVQVALDYQSYLSDPDLFLDIVDASTGALSVWTAELARAGILGLTDALNESLSASSTSMMWNGGNVIGVISGNSDTLNAIGASDVLTVTGSGNIIDMSYAGQINITASNAATTISGQSTSVSATGAGDVLTDSGTGDMLTLSGSNDTAVLSGATGASVAIANNVAAYLEGNNGSITLGGLDTVTLETGSGNVLTGSDGIMSTLALWQSGNSVDLVGDAIQLSTGVQETIGGASDVLSGGVSLNLTLSGTDHWISFSYGTVNLQASASLTVAGADDYINALDTNASSDSVGLLGADDVVVMNYGTVGLTSGDAAIVSLSEITLGAGDSVLGGDNTLALSNGAVTSGADVAFGLVGTNDSLSGGTGDTLTLSGSAWNRSSPPPGRHNAGGTLAIFTIVNEMCQSRGGTVLGDVLTVSGDAMQGPDCRAGIHGKEGKQRLVDHFQGIAAVDRMQPESPEIIGDVTVGRALKEGRRMFTAWA
jgi:hypothetical protein